MQPQMVKHFFHSFAQTLRATLYIELHGENSHHQVESLFKGLGLIFKRAARRRGQEIPSTKGVL
jgi:imidazoleglycerol-phosphate dehydratase/histidinol-phosphatase